jgi:streptogramin lyase
MRLNTLASFSLASILALASAGCGTNRADTTAAVTTTTVVEAGIPLKGNVHAGQQLISGAHVYLLAANTTGYGQASVSLLNASMTGTSDSLGAYVQTDSNGNFSIASGYTCRPSAQVYVLASGGNTGKGINTAATELAVLGNCPSTGNFANVSNIAVNEVTTVAAAYALAAFATDATHVSSSGTAAAKTGIANAFAAAANLASVSDGIALAITPAGNGTAPQKTVNLLANILDACIASTGSSSASCSTLFGNALSAGTSGTEPSDTATAAINIAHNPSANVAALYALPTATPPYTPMLATQPNDLTLSINFTGAGINGPSSLAIDSQGNVWTSNPTDSAVAQLSAIGAPLSPATGIQQNKAGPIGVSVDLNDDVWVSDAVTNSVTRYSSTETLLSNGPIGYTGGGLNTPQAIAVDANGNAWAASFFNTVSEFSSSGTPISPAEGYTGGGLNGPGGIAVDPAGSVWIANCSTQGITGVSKFSSAGVAMSPATGFIGGGVNLPFAVAIDKSGNAWVANLFGNSVSELTPSGAPVSPNSGFTGGGLDLPFAIAIDGLGHPWVANYLSSTVTELDATGAPMTPATGLTSGVLTNPQAIAVDGSGNVWVANSNDVTVTEVIGVAAPVITPLAAALKANALGTRP